MPRRRWWGLAPALAVLVIAGCSPAPTPMPVPTSTPTPSPTMTSTPEPSAEAWCSGILDSSAVLAAFGAGLQERDPAISEMAAIGGIPGAFAIRQLGGTACEISNGEPYSEKSGFNSAYVGVRVEVLPAATAQWDRYVDYYGSGVTTCGDGGYPGYCKIDALASDAWISMEIINAASTASATALAQSAIDLVEAGAGVGTRSTIGDDVRQLPDECSGLISDASVKDTLELSTPVRSVRPAGGWSIGSAAKEEWGGPECSWLYEDGDVGVGSVTTLAGGLSVWPDVLGQLTQPSQPEWLPLVRQDSNQVWIRCEPDDSSCIADIIMGGNWIEVTMSPDLPGRAFDQRAAVGSIAQAIVANFG